MSKNRRQPLSFEESEQILRDFDALVRPARYVLCVDFEATCDSDRTKIPRHESEIIEFGAVLVDTTTGERLLEFSRFVKPQIHPTLSAFCTELTTITQEQVDGGLTFPQACNHLELELDNVIGDAPLTWVSWGQYDCNQLEADCKKHGIASPLDGVPHLNLKNAAAAFGKRAPHGLDSAVKGRGLQWHGTHHRGVDDAINVGNVLLNILGK